MAGKLFFVATPIGNLKDVSFRAIETLKSSDEIYCEDTRSSLKFLNHYEISKPLFAYHKFNYKEAIPSIIEKLKQGKNLCLITDAGLPGISDPGSELIPFLNQESIEYTVIPGACAFVSSVVLSGIPAPFTFVGFLPDNKKEERKVLEKLKFLDTSLIFYIAPHKLIQTIKTLFECLGDRDCISTREITKIYEQVEYFTLKQGYPKEPKGEYVLIVKPNKQQENDLLSLSVKEHFDYYVNLGYEKNDAIKLVAKDRDVAKNIIYKQLLNK